MKGNGKDKTTPVSTIEPQAPIHDERENGQGAVRSDADIPLSIYDEETDKEQGSNINGKDGPIGAPESASSAVDMTADDAGQDMEMDEASPTLAEATEQDTTTARAPPHRSNSGSGLSEAINQEDLDGGLLDGALDDYDDLDQDTEDTEVGNVDDFSDDDNDDDEMHSPGELSHADTSKSDQDSEQEDIGDQRRKGLTLVHSDDSDSDLPEPEGSDIENEDEDDADDDDDDEEEDADEEDAEDGDMGLDENERPSKTTLEPRKEVIMSQKPTLNRPSTTTEELKDSGDELSDLSDFDDTDDSDEDDDVPNTKPTVKESNTNFLAAAPVGNGRPQAGGRKRSVQDASKDSAKQEQEFVKTEQKSLTEITNGKARLSERKISETADVHHSDKESESEEHQEEEEEEHEKPAEEEEEEEDLETKQLHKDALEALTSIEVEFASLRDKMYEERMTELDREVEMINAGTHPELSSLMQEIEQKREQRLRFADMGKKYTIDIAQNTYQVAEYRAHCTFQSARRTARTHLVQQLGKRQQQLLMELRLSSDTHKRKVIDDKATLVRSRKLRRIEANELRNIGERLGFPASRKLAPVTDTEMDRDFEGMGLARPLPSSLPAPVEHDSHASRISGHLPPSIPISHPSMTPRPTSNHRWTSSEDYLPVQAPPAPPLGMMQHPGGGRYYGRPDVEIRVLGDQCVIDGKLYKNNDSVVVLDAVNGTYNAKYLSLANDEITLQKRDGSKTRLHLNSFRAHRLCMKPKP